MTNQRDQLVTGIVTVALTSVFMAVVFVPQHRRTQSLRAGVAALQAEEAHRAATVAGLTVLQEQEAQLQSRLADFNQHLPPTAELGDFLEQVNELAARLGVLDPEIKPLGSEARQERSSGLSLQVMPIEMAFAGDFASVYGFIRAIESLPRAARISTLKVARTEQESPWLEARIVVQVYYQDGIGGRSVGG